MSSDLTAVLLERIAAHGSLSVGEYMQRCNAHYYGTRDPFGVTGDFITAPEISQVFGELLGAWLQEMWQQVSGAHCLVAELGPGRGTLMKDMLRVTRHSGLHQSADVLLVEQSPVLEALQQKTLARAHPRITWQEDWEPLPPLPLFLVANEFLDALPVEQYTDKQERRVTCIEGKLAFWPEGEVVREESPASEACVAYVAAHIRQYGGAALFMDYGYSEGTQADTLQAVRAHAYADLLTDPGEADLTAHVNFGRLVEVAAQQGVAVSPILTQGAFLSMLGAELRTEQLCAHATPAQREHLQSGLARLISPQQMGGQFKVMAITSEPVNLDARLVL